MDSHAVEGYNEVFQHAAPLASDLQAEAKADFEFVEFVDGRAVKSYALYREGEVLSEGRWYRVDAAWHYRWRIMYDPAHAAEFLKKSSPRLTRPPFMKSGEAHGESGGPGRPGRHAF